MKYAIILAGGQGMRFWPLSRELEPKQFMRIKGDKTLMQSTISRLEGLINNENIYIITNESHFYELKKQVSEFRIPDKNIILEPQGKNTAPAIGLCAKLIFNKDKDAMLLVFPADHHIERISGFHYSLRKAIFCAAKDMLVTIGIKPYKPSTGYGYIEVSPSKTKGFFHVKRFLEKPRLEKAQKYFKDKNFYWNSGIFIWKAGVFLEELRAYLPKLYSILSEINKASDIEKVWKKIDSISVDYGIMEHSKKVVLLPAEFIWTDLGSWDALADILSKDKDGNIKEADLLDLESKGIYVFGKTKRLIATIGLKDLVIVDTADALLVCDKNRTQDVKKIVERLKQSRRKECRVHMTEKRPWGSYTVLEHADGYKIKVIEIEPKKRLSLQRHNKRTEHWVVVCGCAKVTSGKSIRMVNPNESIYIPSKQKHRLENPGNKPVKIVEVQTGDYLEEDDIERFDDDFKR